MFLSLSLSLSQSLKNTQAHISLSQISLSVYFFLHIVCRFKALFFISNCRSKNLCFLNQDLLTPIYQKKVVAVVLDANF